MTEFQSSWRTCFQFSLTPSFLQNFQITWFFQNTPKLLSPKQVSEKTMATHSSTLAWKIPWTEEPSRRQSMGSHRVRQDWSDLAVANRFLLLLPGPMQLLANLNYYFQLLLLKLTNSLRDRMQCSFSFFFGIFVPPQILTYSSLMLTKVVCVLCWFSF